MAIIDYDNIEELGIFSDSLGNNANNNQIPGVNSNQISQNSISGLNSFIEDVDTGLIGGLRGWTTTCVFSSATYNTIAWTSGTINMSNGNVYNITAGTLTLTSSHYIYLDTAISSTVLQNTTTPGTSVGGTKLLVAFAKINSDTTLKAIIKTFGGQGDNWVVDGLSLAASAVTAAKTSIASINPITGNLNSNTVGTTQLVTGSVTANEILNGTITAGKLNVAAINATTGDLNVNTVGTTQLVAGSVTPTKITSYNFQISAGTFTNNSPTAGKIAWANVKVVYNGTEYTITNGSCLATDKHVYWQLASPNVFSASATLPALGNDDFLVLFNDTGTALFVWNSTVINGNRITSGSITATNIAANTLTANEIAAGAITADEIAAGAVTAVKITSLNFMVSAGTFTNNSPLAGKIAWTGVKVVYNGTEYTVSDGNCDTTDKHIYWQLASPTVLAYSATLPALGNDDFLVLFNNAGVATFVWNSTVINGNRITAGSVVASNLAAHTITANEIAATTITASEIAAATITGAKIAAGTIEAINIKANTITANEIAANTITGSKIYGNTIGASELSTSIAYAGALTISSGGYVGSGQSSFDSGTGWWIGNASTVPKFSIGNSSGSKMTWDGSTLTVNGKVLTGSDSVINGTYVDSLAVSKLATGTISSKQITLGITAGTGDSYIAAGKSDFTNTDDGFILGLDDSDSDKAKLYIGSSTAYMNWDGSGLTVVGGTVTGGTIQTASGTGQRIVLTSTYGIQSFDSSNKVRVRLPADGNGMTFFSSGEVSQGRIYGKTVSGGTLDGTRWVNIDNNGTAGDGNLSADNMLSNYGNAYFNAGGTSYTSYFLGKMKIPVGTNLY